MRAITYSEFGAACDVLTLETLDMPIPADGEVCVELAYSGVNPSDVKKRAGGRPGVTKPAFPKEVPHSDGAGTIVKVGAGVSSDLIGTRVWIWNGQWGRAFGTAASHIVVPVAQAVPLPEGVSMETGASLGIPGLTACHTVFGGGDVRGQTVLVQGGAGSVGYLAVQLARWGGARVIATASPADFDYCKQAGAQAVIDYRAPDAAEQIIAANDGALIDRIIEVEFGINAALDTEVIAPSGTIAAYGSAKSTSPEIPFYGMMFKNVTLDTTLIYILPDKERAHAIERLHTALTDGALSCPVSDIFNLADCAKAHEAIEQGARKGAVLVKVQE